MNELTPIEQVELLESECAIEKGMIDVGQNLLKIRDAKLYRESQPSFEKYCQERWGFKKTYVYQLISAESTKRNLSAIADEIDLPTKESQLREVAKAPVEKQAEIVKKANELAESEDRVPIAKDFKEAREELVPPPEVVETSAIADVSDPVANTEIAKEVLNHINAAKRLIRGIDRKAGCEMIVGKANSICHDLDIAKGNLLMCIPHATCPRCKGKPDGCTACGNLGWVTKHILGELNG